jgi:imidazolonepropionase-like amidohydrolase
MPVPLGPLVVIRGATLLLATGRTIPKGTLVLDKGKISAVFEGDAPTPAGTLVIDGTGKFVTPGILDTHSHLGVYPMPGVAAHEDGNEMVSPVTPQVQSVDAFWPQDPGILRAVKGGVTALQALPGSVTSSAAAVIVKLCPGSSRAMHFAAPTAQDLWREPQARLRRQQAPHDPHGQPRHAARRLRSKARRDWDRWAETEGAAR